MQAVVRRDGNGPHAEDVSEALGEVVNHCPYGCPNEALDEYGYCDHLLGFTNDGKNVETLKPRLSPSGIPTGQKHVTRENPAKVKTSDCIKNPQRVQKDEHGHEHMANLWFSSRVYRETLVKPKETAAA